MIPTIRLHSQQLINPVFNNPKDLVSWMGGIQAQDYTMSKWCTLQIYTPHFYVI